MVKFIASFVLTLIAIFIIWTIYEQQPSESYKALAESGFEIPASSPSKDDLLERLDEYDSVVDEMIKYLRTINEPTGTSDNPDPSGYWDRQARISDYIRRRMRSSDKVRSMIARGQLDSDEYNKFYDLIDAEVDEMEKNLAAAKRFEETWKYR